MEEPDAAFDERGLLPARARKARRARTARHDERRENQKGPE
jgi:hypothetical protein